MILLIGGQKGGTGKSTIATNIAAALAQEGKDVLLIDGNAMQGTASNWAERRDSSDWPKVPCIEKSGNLNAALKDLQSRYEHIIVDTGGQDSREFRTALVAADRIITPIRPSQADAETLLYVGDVVAQAKDINPALKAFVLITNAPSHPAIKLVEETQELITDLNLFSLLSTVIYHRKAYMDALLLGAGVTEINNPKAAHEVLALVQETCP